MKTKMIVAALVSVVTLSQMGFGRFEPDRGRGPWRDDRRDDRRNRDEDRRDWLTEGSAWTGSRTNKEGEFAVDGRIISRTPNSMVMRTREKDNDNLVLEWTFEVRDQSLKLIKVVTTSRGDGQRDSTWGSGEVRELRDEGRRFGKIDVDYGWSFKEGRGNGKGKRVEGSLKLRRD